MKAIQVITGIKPIEIMVQERSRIYEVGRESNKQIQEESNQEWQRRWELDTDKARWTKRLIRNIEAWCQRRHGEIEYYLTQFLGGHGCFNAYLKRFGLKNTDKCWYCGRAIERICTKVLEKL
ncbi:hypothetical protein NQ314_012514 [Rhamnusium bicolor]|uniref:Uncharacterized protein n=1 Tax=Rhamnusium bicolor TaxID=1586634 RepID=A0AAV8XBY3_9CUCU|nr:hypothetical protein NQ314_012514 [Rhamnusium bicolor]